VAPADGDQKRALPPAHVDDSREGGEVERLRRAAKLSIVDSIAATYADASSWCDLRYSWKRSPKARSMPLRPQRTASSRWPTKAPGFRGLSGTRLLVSDTGPEDAACQATQRLRGSDQR
jgi:hypothetical protein